MRFASVYSLLLLLWSSVFSYSQGNPQDCIGAIPVCSNTINNTISYLGSGNIPNEINSTSSCIGGGEVNSVWYAVTIQTAGDFGFLLTPQSPTDYDWAVFNLSNATCADIFTNPALLVSCNFAPVNTATGPNGNNAPGIGFNSMIPVQAGETYIVFINKYGANNSAFDLDFSMSTAQIFDNNPPSIVGLAAPLVCNANSFTLQLSEAIKCGTFAANTFTVNGPSGPIGVASVACAGTGMFSDQLVVNLSTPLTESGNYTVTLTNGSIQDLCGNAMTPGSSAPTQFQFAGITFSNPTVTTSLCYQATGSAAVTVNGGTVPLQFVWTPAGGPNASTWNSIFGGEYSLTVTDANGCSNTQDFVVPTQYDFALQSTQTPDTCSKGVGIGQVTITGTSGPYTIEWLHNGNSGSVDATLIGDSAYVVSVTDKDGCKLLDTLFVQDIRNDSLLSQFHFVKDTVDILLPIGQAVNESQNYVSFLWLLPSPNENDSVNLSPTFFLPNGGFWPIELVVRDQNGCTDTSMREIYVAPDIYYFIPNTFTPNGNVRNDIWKPAGIGFDTATYFMRIYNRWGEIVYTTADHKEGWDGNDLKGRPCPSDTYVYRITMNGLELEDYGDFKGFVNLIR